MKKRWIVLWMLPVLAVVAGCGVNERVSRGTKPAVMQALHTAAGTIRVDGRLDEPIWQRAPVYSLSLGADQSPESRRPEEAGQVQLAWDESHFYVGIRFEDSDIVAEGTVDQLKHFELGDQCELFLKPEAASWYWELYVTPRGNKSSFFFPGRGRLGLPSNMDYTCGLEVGARCKGTLGDWKDKDTGWTAEMAMPIKDLSIDGVPFAPGTPWRILLARYNYGRTLGGQGPELTMVPRLSETNYHLHAEYGCLELVE